MHSYMRAIGFSDIKDGNEIKDIIHDVFYEYDKREAVKRIKAVLLWNIQRILDLIWG